MEANNTMRENDLQLNSTGVLLKTSEDKVDLWKAQLIDALVELGYKKLRDTAYGDSYHVAFYHITHGSVKIDGFNNGYIQISTKDTARLLANIIPNLEKSLVVIFNYVTTDKSTLEKSRNALALTTPSSSAMSEFLSERIDSHRWRSTEMESNATYLRMQGEIEEAKKKITTTKDDLSTTEAKLEHLSEDLETFNDKRKEDLRKSFEYYYPHYYSKYGGAYHRYLDEYPYRGYGEGTKYLPWRKL